MSRGGKNFHIIANKERNVTDNTYICMLDMRLR